MQVVIFLFTICLTIAFTLTKSQYASESKVNGEAFLYDISQRSNVYKLKSGMLVEILGSREIEDAKSPNEGDTCSVTHSGSFINGYIFEEPTTTSFNINEVIQGWAEALQLMVEGDKWRLYVPYYLAYGEEDFPVDDPVIPAFSTLVFELELHYVDGDGKAPSKARAMMKESLLEVGSEL